MSLVYRGNAHALWCGDLLGVLPDLLEESVQCVWTDPPYNIKTDYGEYKDNLDPACFRKWCANWINESANLLQPGGAFWLLCSDDMADWIGALMTEHVGPRRRRIIWREAFAQYQSKNFTCETRHLFYHVKPGAPHQWHPDAIRVESARQKIGDKRANPAGRVPGNVWEFPRVCGTFKARYASHPCQVPAALVDRCLRATTSEGDVVLDPFMGSGTTAVVASQAGRGSVGIELNPEYCQLTTKRMRDATH